YAGLLMRIIGGQFRGRKLKQPEPGTVRPTMDRIREAVFNIIAAKVPDSRVLDIFAGSGAYGLEALSRGAKEAVFIEKDARCVGIINENIRSLGIEGYVRVMEGDAFETLKLLNAGKERYNIIFSDPPYNKELSKKILIIVNQYDILKHFGFIIVEHHRDEDIPETEGGLSLYCQKTYGETAISVFAKK
ncbi:MAG: 16S rRNA (guanine(966)-N(2))-methyltransferase RsmD, partial [Candidatus Omnitrophota bacterium]